MAAEALRTTVSTEVVVLEKTLIFGVKKVDFELANPHHVIAGERIFLDGERFDVPTSLVERACDHARYNMSHDLGQGSLPDPRTWIADRIGMGMADVMIDGLGSAFSYFGMMTANTNYIAVVQDRGLDNKERPVLNIRIAKIR